MHRENDGFGTRKIDSKKWENWGKIFFVRRNRRCLNSRPLSEKSSSEAILTFEPAIGRMYPPPCLEPKVSKTPSSVKSENRPLYGYRFYDSTTGRWLSRDPIQEKGGLNTLCFADNDPISKTDSLGHAFTLSYNNIEKKPKECGEFSWRIWWQIHPNASTSGGSIVQHMLWAFDVRNESGYRLTTDDFKHLLGVGFSEFDYWEAWNVKGNTDHTDLVRMKKPGDGGFAEDDDWSIGKLDGTKGTLVITGDAYYLDQTLNAWPPGKRPPMNDLPTTPTYQPPLSADAHLVRSIKVSWDCCCGTKKDRATKIE